MLTLLGLNHRSASVDLRERACFAEPDVPLALARLLETTGAHEGLILATCNRVEILVKAENGSAMADALRAFLQRERALDAATVDRHAYVHEGLSAVRHIFEVACGLDSMVLGEPQILGQVKRAYGVALESGATGPVLDRLLQHALSAAKRVRTTTGLSRHAVSIAYAAAQLARTIFDDLPGRSALLIGAGKMTELTARHLAGQGLADMTVTNRTYARAETLAASLGGTAVPWDELPRELARVDIVLTGTAAAAPILTKEQVRQAVKSRRGRPLFIVDVAVPRDVEAAVNDLPGVYLYGIDDLQEAADAGLEKRRRAAADARRMLEIEVVGFDRWRQSVELAPTIAALHDQLHQVGHEELARYGRRLAALSPEQRAIVADLTRSVIQKLLHTPIVSLKAAAARGEAGARAALYREIFGLSESQTAASAPSAKDDDVSGPGPTHAIAGGKDD